MSIGSEHFPEFPPSDVFIVRIAELKAEEEANTAEKTAHLAEVNPSELSIEDEVMMRKIEGANPPSPDEFGTYRTRANESGIHGRQKFVGFLANLLLRRG